MTNEDRDLLLSLRRQQAELQQMLDRLTGQLLAIEARHGISPVEALLPPIPPEAFLPPIPHPPEPVDLPPIPALDTESHFPDLPPIPTGTTPAPTPFGGWLPGVSIAFGLLLLLLVAGSLDAALHLHHRLGLLGRFGIAGLASVVILFLGDRFDRSAGHSLLGRGLLIAGLLGLYGAFREASALAATGITPHPLFAGTFLLVWTFYALLIAERHKSQVIGLVGVILGYLSLALVPVAWFGLGMNLFLTATVAAFLLWRGWTTLATVAAFAAYLTLFRRLIFDTYGDLVLDTSRALPFLPPAVYVISTWIIFTTAIILCTAHAFRGGKRFFLVSLNNAALVVLLALTAYISGYGFGSIGWSLFDTGIALLVVSRLAAYAEQDPVALMGAYAAQGLAVFTTGVIVAFTGLTRTVFLLAETLLFGIAGAFAGDRVLITATYAAGFFATVFAIWQIAVYAHHPWLLGLGGAVIMLINAWSSRGEVRHSPVARRSTVFATSCYCLLALGLIFAAFSSELTDATLPVALALGALVLTFAIYHVSIFELPSLAQILMLGALVLVLFPIETGEELPGWSIGAVAIATLVLLTWWARQRVMLPGAWLGPLTYLYSLALVYLAVLTVHPFLGAQSWMVAASLLSVVFLVYGALARSWPLALCGQILLVLSLYHVFFPPATDVYPWTGVAAAVPVLVTFLTGRAAHRWLHLFPEVSGSARDATSFFASLYKAIALLGVIRLTYALVPPPEQVALFLFLGTFLLAHNLRHPDSLGVRSAFLLSALGLFQCTMHDGPLASGVNTFAVMLLLVQIPLLAAAAPAIINRFESWVMTLTAVFTPWYYVSVWAWPHPHGSHSHLSIVWALFALVLFLGGLFWNLPRLRWCGLAVLIVCMLRVLAFDLWSLPSGVRILTLFFLAMLAIGIGLSLAFTKAMASDNSPKNL